MMHRVHSPWVRYFGKMSPEWLRLDQERLSTGLNFIHVFAGRAELDVSMSFNDPPTMIGILGVRWPANLSCEGADFMSEIFWRHEDSFWTNTTRWLRDMLTSAFSHPDVSTLQRD